MLKFMVGDLVKVRTAAGEDRLVRIAEFGNGVIYVTTETEFIRAKGAGESPVAYLGFPEQDVSKV